MGKRRGKFAKSFGKNKDYDKRGAGKEGPGYDLSLRNNDQFVKYYQAQGIVPAEEWDEFYATLRKNLLITFRITGYKSQSQELLRNIKGKFFSNILDAKAGDEPIPPPKCLSWYPNELAWQVDLTRKVVRSSEHLSRFHDFLIAGTECGAISRQEAVSMIPPLLMDIKSHHKILDMCAAPGSKTAQLIEYLHADAPPGELPTGYVIANDADNKRCYLMVHQVKRLASPCCMIVNHDATKFPKIRNSADEEKPSFDMYDRILCDVPCSGDGTMRKNFDVWTKWHPVQGANMHGLQSKILSRGCRLLAVGGRLVYSTCSLNPVEDEAVVADMLRAGQGALELVDISGQLPQLKCSPGLSTWQVMTRKGEFIESVDDLPEAVKTQWKPSIFPPTKEEAEQFCLKRCIRILPHQQDTGGFFVAVLKKTAHIPGSPEAKEGGRQEARDAWAAQHGEEEKEDETVYGTPANKAAVGEKRPSSPTDNQPQPKKIKIFGSYKEDPFLFMEESNPIWPQVKDFFGLVPNSFPSSQLLYRSEQGQRTLYFVAPQIRDITQRNDGRVKFINMGVKAFSRSPSPLVPQCDFRITMESMGTIVPFVTKRTVTVTSKDAIIITSEENPFTSKLSEGLQEQLNNLDAGSTIFVFKPSEQDPTPNCEIVFCGWRGKTSVRCFGSKFDRAHILSLLGEDLKEINKRVEEKKKQKEIARKEALEKEKVNKDEPHIGNEDLEVEIEGEKMKDEATEEKENGDLEAENEGEKFVEDHKTDMEKE